MRITLQYNVLHDFCSRHTIDLSLFISMLECFRVLFFAIEIDMNDDCVLHFRCAYSQCTRYILERVQSFSNVAKCVPESFFC